MILQLRAIVTMESRLRDVPKDWLDFFEPMIYRSENVEPCWLWTGATIHGLPVMRHPATKQRNCSAPRIMMKLFFDFDETHYVSRTGCHRLNCMNPAHYVVTDQHYKQRGKEDEL